MAPTHDPLLGEWGTQPLVIPFLFPRHQGTISCTAHTDFDHLKALSVGQWVSRPSFFFITTKMLPSSSFFFLLNSNRILPSKLHTVKCTHFISASQ